MRDQTTRNQKLQAGFVPANEMGVVCLFALHAELLGYRIRRVQERFPDCVAECLNDGNREVRIEFEYRASNFHQHGHKPDGCDLIVCWHNDWPDPPGKLRIVELKQYFNAPPSVWIQGAVRDEQFKLSKREIEWAVRKDCAQDDLLLMYRCTPVKSITDIFVARGELARKDATWRHGSAIFRNLERICSLPGAITLNELRENPVLRNAGFVRANMQGIGHRVTGEVWRELYRLLIARSADLAEKLAAYAP